MYVPIFVAPTFWLDWAGLGLSSFCGNFREIDCLTFGWGSPGVQFLERFLPCWTSEMPRPTQSPLFKVFNKSNTYISYPPPSVFKLLDMSNSISTCWTCRIPPSNVLLTCYTPANTSLPYCSPTYFKYPVNLMLSLSWLQLRNILNQMDGLIVGYLTSNKTHKNISQFLHFKCSCQIELFCGSSLRSIV